MIWFEVGGSPREASPLSDCGVLLRRVARSRCAAWMGDTRLEPVVLSEAERLMLASWAKRPPRDWPFAHASCWRARTAGRTPWSPRDSVSAEIQCAAGHTVPCPATGRTRRRAAARVPRTITDAVVVRALEQAQPGGTHWSKRKLAKAVGISPASVLRIWHALGLQPWRTETFKISPDPFLIDKIRDVVGLYLAQPANAVVFTMDDKPQTQALERTAPVLPMIPGVPERRSFDCVRHGTVDLLPPCTPSRAR